MRLKRFAPLLGFVLLAGLLYKGLSVDPTALPAARVGQPFPSFTELELTSGREITEQSLSPGPALVNVWATWCYSCRVEHPYLLALAGRGVPIFGLNYKDDSVKAREWLSQLGDPYRLNVADERGLVGLDLGVYGAPETYVIGADGHIKHRHVGVLDEDVFDRDFVKWFADTGVSLRVGAEGDDS